VLGFSTLFYPNSNGIQAFWSSRWRIWAIAGGPVDDRRSEMKDDTPTRYHAVLRARIQMDVDVRIARVKISDFGTKPYEPKKPEIQTSAEIKHASIDKAIGRRLTV
jgi:hypothetical protein